MGTRYQRAGEIQRDGETDIREGGMGEEGEHAREEQEKQKRKAHMLLSMQIQVHTEDEKRVI